MNRTGALAVVALGLLGLGVGARMRGPSAAPALDCAPGRVRLVAGVARCGGEGRVPSAAQRLMLGQKLDLNRVSEADLARVPGVAPRSPTTSCARGGSAVRSAPGARSPRCPGWVRPGSTPCGRQWNSGRSQGPEPCDKHAGWRSPALSAR